VESFLGGGRFPSDFGGHRKIIFVPSNYVAPPIPSAVIRPPAFLLASITKAARKKGRFLFLG